MNLAQIQNVPVPAALQNFKFSAHNTLLADVVSRLLLFAIIAAGLFFFAKLISAGYQYLTSTGDPAKIQAATKEITNAAIGLLVVVSAYFLTQIIEVVLGITIL